MKGFMMLANQYRIYTKQKKFVHREVLYWIANKENSERSTEELEKGCFRCSNRIIAKDIVDFIPNLNSETKDVLSSIEVRVRKVLKELIDLEIITPVYKAKSKKEQSIYRYNIIDYSSKKEKEKNNNVIKFKAKEFIESESQNEIAVTTEEKINNNDFIEISNLSKNLNIAENEIRELLILYNALDIKRAIKTLISTSAFRNSKLNNHQAYLIKILNDFNTTKTTVINNNITNEPKKLAFTNYSQRETTEEEDKKMENRLLGWDEDEEVENTSENEKSIEHLENSTLHR